MILIKQADLYDPSHAGKKDVLLGGGKIEWIADRIKPPERCRVIDGDGKLLVPGLIDQHVHIIGGGGEGSFHTRAPEVQMSSLVQGGTTTVMGLLGTDGVTRSVENLVAKAKALKEEGISSYALSGSYGYPSISITGDVKKDIIFIEEILGVKLAISDHRAPNLTCDQLIALASDVRTAGMLGGKAGIVVLHMGDDDNGLQPVFEALRRTSIPIKTFRPTHVSRTKKLLEEAFTFAKMGGYIDITSHSAEKGRMAEIIRDAQEKQVPLDRITFSSDGQGSWSNYDAEGHLSEIGVSGVEDLYRQLVSMVQEDGMALELVLPFATANVAKALELYPKKGTLKQGSDGDLLLLNQDLSLDLVMAGGQILMEEGKLLKKGTYEM